MSRNAPASLSQRVAMRRQFSSRPMVASTRPGAVSLLVVADCFGVVAPLNDRQPFRGIARVLSDRLASWARSAIRRDRADPGLPLSASVAWLSARWPEPSSRSIGRPTTVATTRIVVRRPPRQSIHRSFASLASRWRLADGRSRMCGRSAPCRRYAGRVRCGDVADGDQGRFCAGVGL